MTVQQSVPQSSCSSSRGKPPCCWDLQWHNVDLDFLPTLQWLGSVHGTVIVLFLMQSLSNQSKWYMYFEGTYFLMLETKIALENCSHDILSFIVSHPKIFSTPYQILVIYFLLWNHSTTANRWKYNHIIKLTTFIW